MFFELTARLPVVLALATRQRHLREWAARQSAVGSERRLTISNRCDRPERRKVRAGPMLRFGEKMKISKGLRKDSAQLDASHMNTLLIILIIGVELLIRTSKSEFLLNSDHVSFNFYC